jgi:F420-dependent oxidoreductase-like protein
MELCLAIEGQEGVSWERWLALARACEQHSIPALFRSDHYLNLDGHAERGSLEAWGTLTALAAVTDTLRLGTIVTPVTLRHPAVLAKLVATADQVSGGRVELGLGAGWHQGEHLAYGLPFPPLSERMDILEEQLQILLGLWSDASVSFEGEHYRLHDVDAQPKPIQRPHPPLFVGGLAGPRSIGLAARYADEYNTDFTTVEGVRRQVERLANACERAGRQPLRFSLFANVVVGADIVDLRRRLQLVSRETGVSAAELEHSPPEFWIVGTADAVAEQLATLRQVGVTRVMCRHILHDDLDGVALIGDEVAPLLARP